MLYTPKLLLKLPENHEHVLVEDFNENFTKIDTEIAKITDEETGAEAKFKQHAGNKENPHGVTKNQVGLGSVQDYGVATQAEAEAGTSATKYMTPESTKQAIDKNLTPLNEAFTQHLDEMASTSQAGHAQLNDNTNSTSTTQAATANAVKKVNDALTTHVSDNTKHLVAGDKTKIDGALQKAGGAMTGDLIFQKSVGNIYMRTLNNKYETVLRHNANDTNDVGFDIVRNTVSALHINASNITYLRDHSGNLFSVADIKNLIYWGNGSPEGVVMAIPGALFSSIDGGRLYVKQSGSGNTGWVMK